MKDDISIQTIIHGFRDIMEHIFHISEENENLHKIFTPGYEEIVDKKINDYFNSQYEYDNYNQETIETMRDGVQYLFEKIRNSSEIMKSLLYLTLFHKDEIIHENEIDQILNKFSFKN